MPKDREGSTPAGGEDRCHPLHCTPRHSVNPRRRGRLNLFADAQAKVVNPLGRGRPCDSVRHDAQARVTPPADARGLAQPHGGADMGRISCGRGSPKRFVRMVDRKKPLPSRTLGDWRCRTAAKASRRPLCAIYNRTVDGGMIDLVQAIKP